MPTKQIIQFGIPKLENMNIKRFFRKLFCNVFKVYTQNEVRQMFLKQQFQMAQEIISTDKKVTPPMEFFEQNKKF